MNNNNDRLRVAIQKSGRLREASLHLLTSCGIEIEIRQEQLFCHSNNFPLDLLLVRDDDIPNLVQEGICDFGIVGSNLLQEKLSAINSNFNGIEIMQYLDFAHCRLALAVPNNFLYTNLYNLNRCRIATSYPNLLATFVKKHGIDIDIITLAGSVEIAPRLGIADGICDLVSTGATLGANNLREIETVFVSQAVFIQSAALCIDKKRRAVNIFLDRIAEIQKGVKSRPIVIASALRAALRDGALRDASSGRTVE
jgi:ATP phosphoribosyltransferase